MSYWIAKSLPVVSLTIISGTGWMYHVVPPCFPCIWRSPVPCRYGSPALHDRGVSGCYFSRSLLSRWLLNFHTLWCKSFSERTASSTAPDLEAGISLGLTTGPAEALCKTSWALRYVPWAPVSMEDGLFSFCNFCQKGGRTYGAAPWPSLSDLPRGCSVPGSWHWFSAEGSFQIPSSFGDLSSDILSIA